MIEQEKRTRSNRYKEEHKEKKIEQPKKEIKKEEKIKEPKEHKEHPRLKKIALIIFFLIITLIVYSSFIETKIIKINEYKVESNILPQSFHGIKIAHFSDIHYGTTINKKELEKIVTKINNLKPDIIFFTGDLIDKNITITEETEKELIETLSKLNATINKFAIYGDEDLENNSYEKIITESNFKILKDESTLLYYQENTPIVITAYNPIITNPNYTILTNLVQDQDITNYYKIVLTHEPDVIDKFINYKPNLVLSGHTLGGGIQIPFLKPMFLPENGLKYYEDYYKINNAELYVSNGLGTSSITARLNNLPSINLYRLYKTKNTE